MNWFIHLAKRQYSGSLHIHKFVCSCEPMILVLLAPFSTRDTGTQTSTPREKDRCELITSSSLFLHNQHFYCLYFTAWHIDMASMTHIWSCCVVKDRHTHHTHTQTHICTPSHAPYLTVSYYCHLLFTVVKTSSNKSKALWGKAPSFYKLNSCHTHSPII